MPYGDKLHENPVSIKYIFQSAGTNPLPSLKVFEDFFDVLNEKSLYLKI
jgi:hypothetical protein